MKRILCLLLVVLMLTAMLCGCNAQLIDLTYSYEYGYIKLPNGEVIEGAVSSWKDYDSGDVVQVVIDGKTYLTHYENVVLISN
jgi:hypothetical protein